MSDDFHYESEVNKMLLAIKFLADVDLDGISSTVLSVHSLMPILDPTAYKKALDRGDMETIGKLAEALKAPVKIFREDILPKIPEGV